MLIFFPFLVPPRPMVVFPFSISNIFKNSMDISMDTERTGLEIPEYIDRVGVLNESYGGMTFFKGACDECLSKLELKPYLSFKTKFYITIMMWLRTKDLLQDCSLYDQRLLKLSINKDVLKAEFTYKSMTSYAVPIRISLQAKELLNRWNFVEFSFATPDPSPTIAQLEINGVVRDRRRLYENAIVLHDISTDVRIARNCFTQIACLQIYTTALTKQQKTMAKYTCMYGREGTQHFTSIKTVFGLSWFQQ